MGTPCFSVCIVLCHMYLRVHGMVKRHHKINGLMSPFVNTASGSLVHYIYTHMLNFLLLCFLVLVQISQGAGEESQGDGDGKSGGLE